MSLAFPLSRAAFFARLPVREFLFEPREPQEVLRAKSGVVRSAAIGQSLFEGMIALDLIHLALELELQPLFGMVQRSGVTFLITDPRRPGPAADPLGAILGAATPTLSASTTDARLCSIAGLPGAYQLRQGDALGFTYGASPTRRGYHRVVQTATATSGGAIASLQLEPPLRHGVGGPRPLALRTVEVAVRIVPGSFEWGQRRGGVREGMAFQVQEVIA